MTKVKFCPKCKSTNVNIKITPSAVFGVPQKWSCNDCGFEAYSIFPDVEELEEEEKTKIKKGKKSMEKKVRRK